MRREAASVSPLGVLLLSLGLLIEVGAGEPMQTAPPRSRRAEEIESEPMEGSISRMEKNRLVYEKSPYLLQHADNPVDWHPWSDEAFEKARNEDKPVFLSIGYSTCHWCHVMARESFEDEEVADLLNETFVSIKVDREERPDIDNVYMTVCQMMTGSGGWPLSIFMTPDRKPFYAATYIPKENAFGRVGMKDLIPRVDRMWKTRRGELLESAERIVSTLEQASESVAGERIDQSTSRLAYEELARRFDDHHGGFSGPPKFPTPHNLLYLLRYWRRTGEEKALSMVEKTLQEMRRGGIYDQLGFGFHRYSTDRHWLLPHFEKMLYDQAMLVMTYAEAYQATRKTEYERTSREILDYVLSEMTAEGGGFLSALDADSEGEEGKYYVWSEREMTEILSPEEIDLTRRVFNIRPEGNFSDESTGRRTGQNILHMTQSIADHARALRVSQEELTEKLETVRRKLLTIRRRRVPPHRDDKILTAWNGLMIAAMAKASQAFGDERYARAAEKAMDFILEKMRGSDGRLLHRYRDGEAAIPSVIDDYAFTIWALVELYETTLEVHYLKEAIEFEETMRTHFWDEEKGGFYFTADDAEPLLVRQKRVYDGAIPSANSVAMLNLLRLGRLVARPELEQRADSVARAFSPQVKASPSAFTMFMSALEFSLGARAEVVVVGDSRTEETAEMLRALQGNFIPHVVFILRAEEEETPAIDDLTDFTRYQTSLEGRPTAYVCRNYQCHSPTTSVAEMLEQIDRRK